MNSTVLSGEQLVTAQSRTEYELPTVGIKDFQPSHSWLENKQIQSALDARKDLLDVERVEKRSSLMLAQWRPEKHKAAVTDKAKPWEVFGHHSDNSDWLFPEEALLLMEMNLLECLFGEVPLSIQRGYSVLLGADNGCSLDEYRVFAHLCRAGYRVVRHLPDLTVTAYEKKVRLDQHLDHRTIYEEPSVAQELPRPDLPPKKIVDLKEGTEITIESPGSPLKKTEEPGAKIEVIDLADTSSESSDESDDSDIEIVHVGPPTAKDSQKVEVVDDEDDMEIIEVPVPPKEIVVATIESSDNESDSDRSYDGNWKRRQVKLPFVRPDSMKNLTFSAIDEFCSEIIENDKCVDSNVQKNNSTNESEPSYNDMDSSNSGFISLSKSQSTRKESNFSVLLSRTEILNLMPTMFGQRGKLMTLEAPDPRLIPDSVNPKNKSYTYNMSTLRARAYSTNFRGYFRGRRNFHGPRFNNYGHFQNPVLNFNNPLAVGNGLLPLPQVFGSDVHSMARGIMQFASALLMNMPQNLPNNSSVPFNHHQNVPFVNHRDSPRFYNSPPIFNDPPRNFNTPTHTRFSDSPTNSASPNLMGSNDNFSNSFDTDNVHSRSSGTSSDFDTHNQTFSPPANRRFNNSNRFNRSRGRPYPRNGANKKRPLLRPLTNSRAVDPVFPDIDPAYIKPDIPLKEEQCGKDGDFIPLRASSTNPIEIIEIVDLDNDQPSRGRGRGRTVEKRKRRKMLRNMMRKKMCLNRGSGAVPEVVFLDSPGSDVTVKHENDVSTVSIKAEQNVAVKQESAPVEINLGASIKNEILDGREVKVESRIDTPIKSEEQSGSSSGVRVNIGQDSSGTNLLVEIKIEGSNAASADTPVVKMEGDVNVKTEPDSSSEVQSMNVKNEPVEVKSEQGVVGVKKENSLDNDSPNQTCAQNTNSNQLEELVAEVSSTSALVESSDTQQEHLSEDSEMEVESSECDVLVRTEKSEDLKNDGQSDMVVEASEENALCNKDQSDIIVEDSQSKTVLGDIDKSKMVAQTPKDPHQSGINKSNVVETPQNSTQETMDIQFETTIETTSADLKHVGENVDGCEMNVDKQREISSMDETSSNLEETCSGHENNQANLSSWAEVKKYSVPLMSRQENEEGNKEESDNEDENEIRPLIKPKNCRTIGSVLAALQIFSPLRQPIPEDTPPLKISFDMYLAADFKKSHRGLPHYRIVVFSGSEPMPSPAQVREVNSRFHDSVPVLRAVVMPNSVVFYKAGDVSLPVDDTSYTH